MTLLSRTRLVVVLLVAVTLASAGCTSSSPSPQPAPSPSPTAAVETTPDPSPEPSADPTPELATEPEDVAAYCDAIQAVHDAPYEGPGRSSSEMAEATVLVVDVAPPDETEYWEALAEVYDNTVDRETLSVAISKSQEINQRVERRCGFRVP